jgi:predicted RNase H-like HicB family nuclease
MAWKVPSNQLTRWKRRLGGAAGELAMRYKIALQSSEEGFSVSVPGLPGCWSQGATEDEALQNIRDAIADYLAVVDELLQGAEIREVDVAV